MARGVRRRLYLARRPLRLSAGDAALLKRVLGGLGGFNRVMSVSSPTSRLVELDGVSAVVTPDVPERPLMNAVVYERAGALAAALERLAVTYDEAGVAAWMVLAPAVDGEAKKLLRRAGHARTGSDTGLAQQLVGVEIKQERSPIEWTPDGDPAAMAAICDRAFGFGTAFARAFSGLPRGAARVYIASLDGEPASCVLASDHDGNCAVDLVATLPEAQGRGLSGALVGQVVADAAARDCTTTTVVSSAAAKSIYESRGYRAVCPIQHWVRRRPAF